MKKYNNYLFDFGGVLYNININNALLRFREFSGIKSVFDNIDIDYLIAHEAVDLYEKGSISTDLFREHIREGFSLNCTDEEFDASWNSILVGVSDEAAEIIGILSKNSNVSLLSNTSKLHFERFEPECRKMFSLFDNLYLSFDMGLRKPDPDVFEYVIKHSRYIPQETLFVDDTEINIKAATKLGFNTMKLDSNGSLSDLLHSV